MVPGCGLQERCDTTKAEALQPGYPFEPPQRVQPDHLSKNRETACSCRSRGDAPVAPRSEMVRGIAVCRRLERFFPFLIHVV